MARYLIIGNGVAGINAAETIRGLDPDGDLAMIAGETSLPYSRPMISLILDGSAEPDRLPIRGPDFYDSLGLEALIGHRAVELDPDAQEVRTDKGETVGYDKLLIATGADPRPVKAEGLELANIFHLRTIDDARGMVAGLPGVEHALVLGGGLVGFKSAYGLLKRGVKVTMLISSGYPLSMQVDKTAGEMIQRELEANGLEVRVNIEAIGFEGNGRVQRAHLSDGSRLDCGMVVIGKGVNPAVDFIPKEKLAVDYGIPVDEHLMTGLPNVFAAGDVAEANDLVRDEPWVNAIWPVAVEQGRIAGANMAGRKVVYDGSLGRNVMRVFGLDVLTGGLVNPEKDDDCRVFSTADPKAGTYRKLVIRDGRLIGAAMIGRVEQGGVLLSLINSRVRLKVNPEPLLDKSFNFATLLP